MGKEETIDLQDRGEREDRIGGGGWREFVCLRWEGRKWESLDLCAGRARGKEV